jgi:hypothetical protein
MKQYSIITFIAMFALILIACKDTPTSLNDNNSKFTIKIIDSLSKQELPNVKVQLCYKIQVVDSMYYKTLGNENLPFTEVGILPNPFNDEQYIDFTIDRESTVRIELTKYGTNNNISTLFNSLLEAGQYMIYNNLDLSSLNPGFYNLNFYSDGTLCVQKKALFIPRWFATDFDNEPRESPFKELFTTANGTVEFETNSFTLCNEEFEKYDESGFNKGKYKIMNGCRCFVSFNCNMLDIRDICFDNSTKLITIAVNR